MQLNIRSAFEKTKQYGVFVWLSTPKPTSSFFEIKKYLNLRKQDNEG